MTDETEAVLGHNSGINVSREQLRAFIERIEKLEAEKKEYAEDIRSVYAEAKAAGYDVKVLRAVIRERAKDPQERREFEAIKDTYLLALGMI